MQTALQPLQLIAIDSDKKLQVNKEAVEWLSSVSQDKHIAVVTVVGKYRTGKSYILNRVLLNQNNGFQVGPSINACTKGLWIWPQLIECPNDPTMQYLVMDTQGLNSLEEGEQNDTKVFLMSLLLSSYFIYNSMGSIDEKALQSLSLIINLNKLLQKNNNSKEMEEIISCFPSFLWLVRDFALKLVDEKGVPITPKEYLENSLRLQKSTSDAAQKKNSIRKELANFFKERDCFMLVRPVDDDRKLQNMSKVKEADIRPKFLELIRELRQKILFTLKKKIFKGKPCSPIMFIELCQYFCDSINKGGLPEIESSWDLVCKAETTRIQKKLMSQFMTLVEKYQQIASSSNLNMRLFEEELTQKIKESLKNYKKNALSSSAERQKQFHEKMQEIYQQLRATILKTKLREIQNKLSDINDNIGTNINNGTIQTIFQIIQQYEACVNENQMSEESHLYRKLYQNFKSSSQLFFSQYQQQKKYESNLLTERVDFYQSTLNRIQSEQSKKSDEADHRERQLKRNVFELEIKAREVNTQLERARLQLSSLKEDKQIGIGIGIGKQSTQENWVSGKMC